MTLTSTLKRQLAQLRERAEKASKGPWYIEPDDTTTEAARVSDRWRIVSREAVVRRLEQKSSARPAQLATVYSKEDADFLSVVTPEVVLLLLDHLEAATQPE